MEPEVKDHVVECQAKCMILCVYIVYVCVRERRETERRRRNKKTEVKEERDLKISFESFVPFLLEISFTSGLRLS